MAKETQSPSLDLAPLGDELDTLRRRYSDEALKSIPKLLQLVVPALFVRFGRPVGALETAVDLHGELVTEGGAL